MNNKYLKRVQKKLDHYYSYFKADNILVVSEDKASLPFAYLIGENPSHPNHLLISIAVDYTYSERVTDVALLANSVKTVALTEQFFISNLGITYIGVEAHKYYQIETELPIEDINPPTDTLN